MVVIIGDSLFFKLEINGIGRGGYVNNGSRFFQRNEWVDNCSNKGRDASL